MVTPAVLDCQRGRHLLTAFADEPSQAPKIVLLFRRDPTLDDDVVRVLGKKIQRVSFAMPQVKREEDAPQKIHALSSSNSIARSRSASMLKCLRAIRV